MVLNDISVFSNIPLSTRTLYIFLILLTTLLLHQLRLPNQPPSTWQTTDPKTDITLLISGHCRQPFTYVGVDSRPNLLRHYDISAVPQGTDDASTLNWARVVLLRNVFETCPNVPLFIYSDTDAYIASRTIIPHRLHKYPSVVYQHGMWYVNSGFSAWRNDRMGKKVLNSWYSRYTPDPDFYAEQRAMLETVGNFSWATEGRENGFLGWHIKGGKKFKTEVASWGRWLCYYEQFFIKLTVLPVAIVTAAVIFLILRLRFTGSVQGIRPLVQAGVLFGKLFRNDLFVLICTSALLLIILVTKTHFVGEWRLQRIERLSRRNFSHMLPGGRLLVNQDFLCSGYWCISPEEGTFIHWLHGILLKIAATRALTLSLFVTYGIFAIVVPHLFLAVLFAVWFLALVSVLCGAANLGNIFVLHDVADGTFGRERRVFGSWTVRGSAPRANSGRLEIVKVSDAVV